MLKYILYLSVYMISFFVVPRTVKNLSLTLLKKILFTLSIFIGSMIILLYTDGIGKVILNYIIIFGLICIYSFSKLLIKSR